ncbi:hypothetical protein BGZ72_002333, partial [Mortierella alpina]
MPVGLRVKASRFDQAFPRAPPSSTEEDWSGEKKAASSNLTPLVKPKPKTAAQKKKEEERTKKAQKKKEEEKKKKKIKHMAPSATPSAKGATRAAFQNNLARSGLRQNQADQVKERMQQAVEMVNLIVQHLYLATALLITALTNGGPRLARSINVSKQNKALYRKTITASPSFVYCPTRRLYQVNPDQEVSDAASAAYHAFKLFQVEAGKVLAPLKASYPIYIGSSALDLTVQHVLRASGKVLGYLCTSVGREPTKEAREKLMKWPIPNDATKVKGFLATCGYYRISRPYALTTRMRKGEWDAALDNLIQAAENIATRQPPRPTPEGQLAVQLLYELPQLMDISEDEPESSLMSSVGQYADRQERRVIFTLGDVEFSDPRGDQGLCKKFARSMNDKISTRQNRDQLGPKIVCLFRK